jgi:hypothetical protein
MIPSVHHFPSHNYFEEEEVDLNEWATSWLQYLLAKELTFDNLVRLWGKGLLAFHLTLRDDLTLST